MKLLNNLFLAVWALVQWVLVLAMLAPIVPMPGTLLGLSDLGWHALLWAGGYILLCVTCYTYRSSGFFWATFLPEIGVTDKGDS